MRKITIITLILAIILSLLCFSLSSCAGESIYCEGEGELKVLCTVFSPFDFARTIGGERVTVSILQDSGADLHNYTPTAATLKAISEADVFIYVGGSSDHLWLPDAIRAAGNDDLITLCLLDSVEPLFAELENDWSDGSHDHENGEGHGDEDGGDHQTNNDHSHSHSQSHDGHDHGADEHIWTSVKNAKLMAYAIEDTLSSADPEGAEYYSKNAEKYVSELDILDKELEAVMGGISTMLFADRFPFVYLLHDYHVPYKAAFSGCSTEINAGFEAQIKLIEAVKNNDLTHIFVIEGGSKDLAEAVATETGCEILALDSMQSVKRSDIVSGASYIKIMKKNLDTMKEAFSCQH